MRKAHIAKQTHHRHAKATAGYTLIELLVVLLILALITSVVTSQVFKYLGRANTSAAGIQIELLAAKVDFFRLDVGRYPTSEEGLKALMERPPGLERWSGPYVVKKKEIMDPWDRVFRYRAPGQHGAYDLFSFGADDQEGGDGEASDITNWDQ